MKFLARRPISSATGPQIPPLPSHHHHHCLHHHHCHCHCLRHHCIVAKIAPLLLLIIIIMELSPFSGLLPTWYLIASLTILYIHTRIGLSKYLKFIILVVSIMLDKYATIPNISIVELKLLFKEGSFHLSLKS